MPNRKADIKRSFEEMLVRLENMILIGEFRPRERLIEADLSERLGTSRAWIRDALKLLEAKGLVKTIPYKGAFVAELTEQEVEEIFQVRVALESLCYKLAMVNYKPSYSDRLRELADIIEQASRTGQFDRMMQANSEFHDFIYELSGNNTLIQMLKQLKARFFIFNTFAWSVPDVVARVIDEHRQYIDALETGDWENLERLAEKHISYSKDFYLCQASRRPARLIRGA